MVWRVLGLKNVLGTEAYFNGFFPVRLIREDGCCQSRNFFFFFLFFKSHAFDDNRRALRCIGIAKQ